MMDTEDFISAVFLKPAIWDQKDPSHHNRFILYKLWQEISKQFNTTRKVKRSQEGIGNALLEMEKEKLRFLEEKRAKKDKDDEDLSFFKSLLPHLKNITSLHKLEYRMKVLQLTHELVNKSIPIYIECNTENITARCEDNAQNNEYPI
ncbi:uncharacterized protein LOC129238095 [Anastrepha obliqua]|uniref:uncharacterized protein LOC129238095 n=1 Tax=Anastrepha obliqua TaxID=95512 RepID=UPI002409EAA6|nr:uncharacterized protein LOC129238095 [Anastrepha obliqua]